MQHEDNIMVMPNHDFEGLDLVDGLEEARMPLGQFQQARLGST